VPLRVQAEDMSIWRTIGVLLFALVWTLVAVALVLFGLWGSIDTSGDGPAERDMAGGGWLVIATLSVWSGAFVVCALRLRTVIARDTVGRVGDTGRGQHARRCLEPLLVNARSGNMGRSSQRVTAGMFSSLRRSPVMAMPERRAIPQAAKLASIVHHRPTCVPPTTRCRANSPPFDSVPPIRLALTVALTQSGR